MVASQDWGPVLALPGWPLDCFLMASGAKSSVIVAKRPEKIPSILETPTLAMNGRVDVPKNKLAQKGRRLALQRPG